MTTAVEEAGIECILRNTEDFQKALKLCLLMPGYSNITLVKYLLLHALTDRVYLIAIDSSLRIFIRADITGQVIFRRPGCVLLPKEYMRAVMQRNKGKDITIRYDIQKGKCHIGEYYSVSTLPAEEFTQEHLPFSDHYLEICILEDLPDRLKKVSFSAGRDDDRYMLNALFFDFDESMLCGTDGHRLAFLQNSLPQISEQAKFVIPIEAIRILERLKGECRISFDRLSKPGGPGVFSCFVKFAYADMTIVVKTLKGRYPYWQNTVPEYKAECNRLIINRDE